MAQAKLLVLRLAAMQCSTINTG